MIRVTINGEVKYLSPGMTVQDILDEFENLYTNDTIAVRANGVMLSMEDEINEDSEIEPLTFRDLGASRPARDYSSDDFSDEDENEYAFPPGYMDSYAMMAFSHMLGEGYFDDSASSEMYGGFTDETDD